ncbi:transposase, partial [Escherichia coli]
IIYSNASNIVLIFCFNIYQYAHKNPFIIINMTR